MQTIVIGHRNPDMDSICSAIAYAELKRKLGMPDVVAARAGNTNERIDFILQKFDVPGTNYETVIGLAEIVPNVNIGRHTHPGPESGFMLEGDFVLLVEGQAPLPVKAGESYKVPPGAVHDAQTGANGAKVIATYVVEKGKPLAAPVP